jgi:hypothetical protein
MRDAQKNKYLKSSVMSQDSFFLVLKCRRSFEHIFQFTIALFKHGSIVAIKMTTNATSTCKSPNDAVNVPGVRLLTNS